MVYLAYDRGRKKEKDQGKEEGEDKMGRERTVVVFFINLILSYICNSLSVTAPATLVLLKRP